MQKEMGKRHGCPRGQILIRHHDPHIGVKCYTREEMQRHVDMLKDLTIDDLLFEGDEEDLRVIRHAIDVHLNINFHPRNWRTRKHE